MNCEYRPALCNIVGFAEKKLLDQEFPFPFWPPEECAKIHEILKALFKMPNPPEIELRFQRKKWKFFRS